MSATHLESKILDEYINNAFAFGLEWEEELPSGFTSQFSDEGFILGLLLQPKSGEETKEGSFRSGSFLDVVDNEQGCLFIRPLELSGMEMV